MSQKQFKAMRKLAALQTIGKPEKETRALYHKMKKSLKMGYGVAPAKATPIRTRSHYKVKSHSGEVPAACPPALQPYPKSRTIKGFKMDGYSHTKGYKRQSPSVKRLFSTGFTPWTMGNL